MREMFSYIYRILLSAMNVTMQEQKWWLLRERLKADKYRGILKKIQLGRYKLYLHQHGADIPLEADLKDKPCFPHGIYGIFISKGAAVGKGCTIFQQVTIGSNTLQYSKNRGVPVVGDDVFIGAGAKIIGNVNIGNHVRIGADCVVAQDIEDYCSAVMNKPRIIKKKMQKNAFIPIDRYISEVSQKDHE